MAGYSRVGVSIRYQNPFYNFIQTSDKITLLAVKATSFTIWVFSLGEFSNFIQIYSPPQILRRSPATASSHGSPGFRSRIFLSFVQLEIHQLGTRHEDHSGLSSNDVVLIWTAPSDSFLTRSSSWCKPSSKGSSGVPGILSPKVITPSAPDLLAHYGVLAKSSSYYTIPTF